MQVTMSVIDSIFLPLMLKRPVFFLAKSDYFTENKDRASVVAPLRSPAAHGQESGTSPLARYVMSTGADEPSKKERT